MSHRRPWWSGVAAIAATLAVTAKVTGAPEAAPLNAYFGSLGAYPFTTGESGRHEGVFEVARTHGRMDFLAIAMPTPSAALRKTAASMSAGLEGRFVALWGWRYESSARGNYVHVLEPRGLEENALPHGRFDLFFTRWLPSRRDTTSQTPVVLLPQPIEFALDHRINEFGSPPALPDAALPFIHTIEMITDQSNGSSPDTPGSTPYLSYLNAGFRVAPTADVESSGRTGYAISPRRTAILAEKLSKAHLLDSIRERRVYSSEDSNLRVSFSINGRQMGSVVALEADTRLRIEVTFSDPDEPNAHYWVSLRRDAPGGAIEAARELSGTNHDGDGRVVFTQFRRSSHDEYFVLRLQQMGRNGIDTVWTAPIWLIGRTDPAQ